MNTAETSCTLALKAIMRIVHLISNFRWTERVEPAADLAIAQQKLGHQVRYLCGHNKGAAPEDCIQGRAARKGLQFDDRFHLTKHLQILPALQDLKRLVKYMREFKPEVVHCHLPNAHLLAALAIRNCSPRPILVRTLYEPKTMQCPIRFNLISRPATDGVIVLSTSCLPNLSGKFRHHPERVASILPGIDIDQFANRHELGRLNLVDIPEGTFVVGMVTAIGARRRLDLALKAVALLAPHYPQLRLLICGRGKVGKFLNEPASRLGIRNRVILAGYCRNDDLVRAYHSMNVLLYPMHGSDQSCRTVREALASGVPVVASDISIIKELVRDNQTGLVTDFNSHALAEALEKMLKLEPAARRSMSQAAQDDARARFCRIRQAKKVVEFYQQLASLKDHVFEGELGRGALAG